MWKGAPVENPNPPRAADSDGLGAGTPVLDLERYRQQVVGQFDSDEAATAFLQSLWHIMCAFVDLGMDVKSSTANLPFMRELSSEFGSAAPESKNIKQPTDKKPRKR
jgi:hypothetical protein